MGTRGDGEGERQALAAPWPQVSDARSLVVAGGAFAAAYGLAQASSDVFTTPAGVSVWFPPAALVLTLLLIVPARVGVPLVVVVRLFWSITVGGSAAPLWLSLTNAVLVAGAYGLAAAAIRRLATAAHDASVPGPRTLLAFVGVGVGLGPLAAAAATRFVAAATGRLTWGDVTGVVGEFWVGDAVAIVTLVPLLWSVARLAAPGRRPLAIPELALLSVGPAVAAVAVLQIRIGGLPPLYLLLIPIAVLALRGGLVGAAMGNGIAGITVAVTLGLSTDPTVPVSSAHAFLVVASLTGIALGSLESQRRLAVAGLVASEERVRQMVQAVEDHAIYLLDADGHIVTWNQGAERLKGYRADEVVGRHVGVLHTEEDQAAGRADQLLSRAREQGNAQDEGWRRRKDGSRFWAVVTLTRLVDGSGRITGFTKVTRDLTERREAELELARRAELLERSNEDLSRLASVASHDLQEPLRMVSTYTELLARRYGDQLDDDANELIGFAVDGANRMRELIDDLLAYSRVHTRAQEHRRVDLEEVLDQVRRDLSVSLHETGAQLVVGPLPTVVGEPSQLRQLFQNLVGNAVKYRSDEPPVIHVRARPGADAWELSVCDNGIGIAPSDAEAVFEPFRRLHPRSQYTGTGIGLAICRRILERHGGRIVAEPNEPRGSCFRFTLRAADPEAQT